MTVTGNTVMKSVATEVAAIPTIVLTKNFFPKYLVLSSISGILRMMIMTPTGTPKNILIIVAIPVIPPTTIPAGRRNIFIDAEKSTAPAMTAAASKRYFAYLFLVFSICASFRTFRFLCYYYTTSGVEWQADIPAISKIFIWDTLNKSVFLGKMTWIYELFSEKTTLNQRFIKKGDSQ